MKYQKNTLAGGGWDCKLWLHNESSAWLTSFLCPLVPVHLFLPLPSSPFLLLSSLRQGFDRQADLFSNVLRDTPQK